MTEERSSAVEVLASGGFRIVIASEELTITADPSAYGGIKRPWVARLFPGGLFGLLRPVGICFFLFMLFQFPPTISSLRDIWPMLHSTGPEPDSLHWVFPLFWMLSTALYALTLVIPSNRNLRCTSEGIEVIQVRLGREVRRRWFPKAEMMRVRFAADDLPWFGSPSYLGFRAGEKDVLVLRGLQSVEAQLILNEVQRLGFDVVRDVGMRMRVEIEQSRRKSMTKLTG